MKPQSVTSTAAGLAVFSFLLLAASPSPQAKPNCSISYRASPRLTDLIERRGFRFDGHGRLCAMLTARGLGLDIISQSGVLAERSYGWVSVAPFRTATYVIGAEGRTSITISRTASTPEAENVMMEALSNVLTAIAEAPDVYIKSVDAEEARLRRALAVNR